jgi:hypothetical protein
MINTIIGSMGVMTMMVVVVTFSTSTRGWRVSPASVSFAGKAVRKESVLWRFVIEQIGRCRKEEKEEEEAEKEEEEEEEIMWSREGVKVEKSLR